MNSFRDSKKKASLVVETAWASKFILVSNISLRTPRDSGYFGVFAPAVLIFGVLVKS